MRVVITGILGFIGSHLAEEYLRQGHHVVGIDNLSAPVVSGIEGVHVIEADTRALKTYSPPCKLLVHAASPVGPAYLLSQKSIVSEIVETTQAALGFCRREGAALINISTSEVYGFSGTYHEDDDCVTPHRLSHRVQYAAGKLAAEQIVRTSDVPALSIRPFNVVGPRQSREKGFVLPTFCEQALAGEPLTVFEDGQQERCLTGVWDLCRFIAGTRSGEVVNVGNPHNRTTVTGLAERVREVLGSGSEIVYTSGKEIYGPEYEEAIGKVKTPDISLAEEMGWVPEVGLDDLIRLTAAEIEARTPCQQR